MSEDMLRPGWPGRGYDPTAGFTNVQWYMYHQRNVVYFAAFSDVDTTRARALAFTRSLVAAAPQFNDYYRDPVDPPDDRFLARLISIETVESFEGFPDLWLDDGAETFDDPDLPFFRIHVARLAAPDAMGRRSFVLIQLSHTLAEGPDAARLSRSRSGAHDPFVPRRWPDLPMMIGGVLAAFAVPMQLVAARIYAPHPGRIVVVTRAYPRKLLSGIARGLKVRQQALFVSLVSHVICNSGTPEGKPRVHLSSSALHDDAGYRYDPFIRIRTVFESFRNQPDFLSLVRAVDKSLAGAPGLISRIGSALNNATSSLHRRLARFFPRLYEPRVFDFMPGDVMFSLVPPHHLLGPLTQGLTEPVYSGASLPGINGCVVVPGRKWITFNFHIEEHLVPNVERMDAILPTLPTAEPARRFETT